MAANKLEESLRMHFDSVAGRLPDQPTLEQLCEASSKEARVWAQPEIYDDLMQSLQKQLEIRPEHRLLEVGCAAGFLAVGLSGLCGDYAGVDLSESAIVNARKLGLSNAHFEVAAGGRLPFEASVFDRALSYDVFTNFPDMDVAGEVVTEMLRVTKDDGLVLVGAIPDADRKDDYFEHAARVARELDERHGPRRLLAETRPGLGARLRDWVSRRVRGIDPTIVNHLFTKDDFRALGERLGVRTEILPGHDRNPYREFRFNVLYRRTA